MRKVFGLSKGNILFSVFVLFVLILQSCTKNKDAPITEADAQNRMYQYVMFKTTPVEGADCTISSPKDLYNNGMTFLSPKKMRLRRGNDFTVACQSANRKGSKKVFSSRKGDALKKVIDFLDKDPRRPDYFYPVEVVVPLSVFVE